MIKKIVGVSCLLAFSAAPVLAEDMGQSGDMATESGKAWSFGDMDVNQDQKLSKEELSAKGASLTNFDAADANQDGMIDKSEFIALGHE